MISIRKLFLLLLFLQLILLVLNFVSHNNSWVVEDRFDLNLEANVPTWFSTILLFSVSVISLFIFILQREKRTQVRWNLFWLIFSGFYCFLSLDETSRIHEGIDNIFNIKWTYIYMPLTGLFFLLTAYFLLVINKNSALAWWIIGGLIIYALGGLFFEILSYYFFYGPTEVAFEEGFEMLGTTLVLTGCLLELKRLYKIPAGNSV